MDIILAQFLIKGGKQYQTPVRASATFIDTIGEACLLIWCILVFKFKYGMHFMWQLSSINASKKLFKVFYVY